MPPLSVLTLNKFKFIFLFLFAASQCPLSFSYTLSTYEIKDLESNDYRFISDAYNWVHPALYSIHTVPYSFCYYFFLLGGYAILGNAGKSTPGGHYFQRTFYNLPTHSRIHFSFQVWMLDVWENTDYLQFYFDSVGFNGWAYNTVSLSRPNYCGTAYGDLGPIVVFGSIDHSASTLTVTFIGLTDQMTTDESYGVRDVNLLLVTSSALTTNSLCANSPIVLYYQHCTCSAGLYWTGAACAACDPSCAACYAAGARSCYKCKEGYGYNGISCFACSTNCATCNGTGSYECTSCKAGFALYQNRVCVSVSACVYPFYLINYNTQCYSFCAISDYVYWNGTCTTTCKAPYIPEITSGVLKNCRFPCTTGEYLFYNGTCKNTCPTPLRTRFTGGKPFCDLPCNSSHYLYMNGSCSTIQCATPFTEVLQQGIVKACVGICTNPSEFFYWNGTCSPYCPNPLRGNYEGGVLVCSLPCPNGEFLYWNGSCIDECNSPLAQTMQDAAKVCEYSCLVTQHLYQNGSCLNTCDPNYVRKVQGGRNFCDSPCLLNEFYLVQNSSCNETCPAGFFGNNITKKCQECEIPGCINCPTGSPRKCLECTGGTIIDTDDICKNCSSFRIEYVKSLSQGHQYKLRLTPTSCDLDPITVQSLLKVNNNSQPNFPPYSFEVIKLGKNVYRVNLLLEEQVLESKTVPVQLLYLNSSMRVPKKLIPSPTLQKIAQYSGTAQGTVGGVMGASFGGTMALGAAAALWSILSFQQFVGYFIYLNVEMPPQVNLFLSLFQSISWDMLPNPLASLTSKLSKDILSLDSDQLPPNLLPPPKFNDNQVRSFFIQNGGSIMATNIMLLFVLCLTQLLRKIPFFSNSKILKIIKVSLKWNIIARTFLENGIPLALAIFLQFNSLSFENSYLIICATLAFLSIVYLIIMTCFLTRIINKRSNVHLDKSLIRKIYGTLYEGMVLGNTLGKYYHLIILLRGILLVFLLVFCANYPLIQSSMLIYYNFGLLYYLFRKAAFENRKLTYINRIKEICILVGEICILFLQFQVNSKEYNEIFGWLMLASLASAFLIELGYTVIIQILEIKTLYRKILGLVDMIRSWISKKSSKINFPRSKSRPGLRPEIRINMHPKPKK